MLDGACDGGAGVQRVLLGKGKLWSACMSGSGERSALASAAGPDSTD